MFPEGTFSPKARDIPMRRLGLAWVSEHPAESHAAVIGAASVASSVSPVLFMGEIDREAHSGRDQAGVRSDPPDVPWVFSTGGVCRSSVSEMAQAALTSPMWLKA